MIFKNFKDAIIWTEERLRDYSYRVDGSHWQSLDISDKPEMKTREVFDLSFRVALHDAEEDFYADDIKPNLPWADDHFEERVAGLPLNPGDEWKNWPWSLSADKFRTEDSKFSHTYMERYWPKMAGDSKGKTGIRYDYGDAMDVVNHLIKDPYSRQAYLPIFFPEDTGVVHGERVPCTLGYHFLMRGGYMHCTYYIRSCDFVRHFRDDLYLSVRLQLWMLEKLRGAGPIWSQVAPGYFVFHCASMHCFENDHRRMFDADKTEETVAQSNIQEGI